MHDDCRAAQLPGFHLALARLRGWAAIAALE
jgi:hypothetical protein